ncbi:MAG: hypothetical protein ABIS67_12805 [Candidatus Eisenbacteria bacterium]
MRLRAGLILFCSISLILFAGGCRKPLAPTFDRNQAPETWITAAPLDTITYREGVRPIQTDPSFIPFRYHLYWAGSDPDGKVAGFYFAIVETLPLPIAPATTPPPLPGPKAKDYKFTAKTDSVFIFSVSDSRADREHAFYIYAVDNNGKPDPTPARFIFNSIDRYPPVPIIDSFVATGFIWEQDPTTLALSRRLTSVSVPATDTFRIGAKARTTVPNQSRLDISWHSEITTVDNPAVAYRYKLDEPEFVTVGSSTTTASYNTGPEDAVGPGLKVFRLKAIDRAGGARETSRIFQMNIPPTTWFSGPDRSSSVWIVQGTNRFVNVPNWGAIPNLAAAGLMSPDSVKIMPSQRIPRRTFYEIYGNRIYARQERDTVNMNSWVVFHNGGFDADSPYDVVYRSNDPRAPDSTNNPVLQIRPSNGSPIGFRSRIPMRLSPTGSATGPSQTGLYPVFDPASVSRLPAIASYWGLSQSGTAFLFARAEDGNGQLDARIGSRLDLQPLAIVYAVDSTGSANPDQIALRPLILTFFVNRAPYFTFPASFRPLPNGTYARNVPITMPAIDDDPYDPAQPASVGGPTATVVFRYSVKFRSPLNGGAPGDSATFAPVALHQQPFLPSSVTLPDSLGGTQVRVMIELCDCSQCENVPGQGRCNYYSYLINVPAPPPLASTSAYPSPGNALLFGKKRGER